MTRPVQYTIDQLVLLDAIARVGSFAGAAKELGRVPSAASYTIRALEEALGVPVFRREGRRAVLTPEGQLLLQHARVVLREVRRLEAVAAQLRDGWEPELHVVIDGALPMGPISATLREIAARQVPTRIRVDIEYQDGVADRFLRDSAQIMLVLELDAVPPGLHGRPLPAVEMALVAGASHPLVGAGRLRREDLNRHMEVIVRDSAPRHAQAPRASFLGTPNVLYLADFHAKRLALLGAVGFGWMPAHLITDDLAVGALVRLDVEGGSAWTYLPRVITPDAGPAGRAASLFLELLDAQIGQHS